MRGVITVDADGQHAVNDILACADKLIEVNFQSCVMGCRNFSKRDVPKRSRFGNNLTVSVMRLSYGVNISDTQTGLRGIPRTFLNECLIIKGERFEYETNMLIEFAKRSFKIEEVKISTIYIDENSESHFNPIKDSIKIYALFSKYLLSSIVCWLIDIGVFAVLVKVLQGNASLIYITEATIIARIISSTVNYMLNRNVVFKSHDNVLKTFLKYLLLCIFIMMCSSITVTMIYWLMNGNEALIKIFVDSLLVIVSYKVQKNWIFSNSEKTEQ